MRLELRGGVDSYWRNDSVNQPKPGTTSEKPLLYFISGTGDGGLIDLLRVKIVSFNQARIIDDLVDPNEDAELLESVRELPNAWKDYREAVDEVEPEWLFNKLEGIKGAGELTESAVLGGLANKLKDRIRSDTAALLNGSAKSFSDVLSLDKASLFNCLSAYLLYELGEFNYVHGECLDDYTKQSVTIDQQPEGHLRSNELPYAVDRVIIRHGTTKEQCLELVGLHPENHIDPLTEKQKSEDVDTGCTRKWPAGWPPSDDDGGLGVPVLREFNPEYTRGIATTFVSSLSDILIFEHGRTNDAVEVNFRITIHRLIQVQEEVYFQQTAYYAGAPQDRTTGEPGRIFDVNVGLVGLAARAGRAVVLKRGANWGVIWQSLQANNQTGVRVPPGSISSMIAIPILAIDAQDHAQKTSLVLYMDSASDVLFDDHDILERVLSACKGFVKSMQRLIEHGDIRLVSSSFSGLTPELTDADTERFEQFSDELFVPNVEILNKYEGDLIATVPLHWDFQHRK